MCRKVLSQPASHAHPDPPAQSPSDRPRDDLLAARQAEAAALFVANQAQRTSAERVLQVLIAAVGITVAAGIAQKTMSVVIPLPAVCGLALSYVFRQYADLTTMGAARRRLEDSVNSMIGAPGLIYETAVAPIRREPRLLIILWLMWALIAGAVLAIVAVATVAAAREHWAALAAYLAFTVATLISAYLSFADMRRSWDVAMRALDVHFGSDRLVWIPRVLEARALGRRSPQETVTEFISSVIELGAKHSGGQSPNDHQNLADGLGHERPVWISSKSFAALREHARGYEAESVTAARLISAGLRVIDSRASSIAPSADR